MFKRAVHIWICILLNSSASAPYLIYQLCSICSWQDQRDSKSKRRTARKMSVTFDCGFTHAAIKNCISDSKGNALPYGERYEIYLNFFGTYQERFSFATLKLFIKAHKKFYEEHLKKFTSSRRGEYFQHFSQQNWSKLQVIEKQEHSRQNCAGQ